MMPQGNVACVCFLNAATVLFVNRQLALSTLSSRNCSEEWAAQEEAFRALPRPECCPPAERSQKVIPGPVWFDALNNKLHSMWGISKWNKGKLCWLWLSWWPAPNRDWAKGANYPRHLMTSVILPHRQTTRQTWQHGIPEFSASLPTGRLFLGTHSHWETWEDGQVDASKASEQLRVPGSIIVVTTINTTNTLLVGVSPQQLTFPSRSNPWYHLLKDVLLPTCYQVAHSHTRQVLVPSPWLS